MDNQAFFLLQHKTLVKITANFANLDKSLHFNSRKEGKVGGWEGG